MAESYFVAQTLDDMLRAVIEAIQTSGRQIQSTKGASAELTGVLLELTDARARLSRTETRGRPFSCLGELCWYLGKTNSLEPISYYIPRYREYADGGIVFGGYGPRLFSWRNQDQVANVIALLRERPSTRRAVIQLFDALDIAEEHKDTPCTCMLQFMIRDNALHMFTCMRSNDVFLGLPHDIFSFTMLQELLARTLSVQVGSYKHAVGSLHLYDDRRDEAMKFLGEGWQATGAMPPMPLGDPWPSVKLLQEAERLIRTQGSISIPEMNSLDPYWCDLIRLLQAFRFYRDRNIRGLEQISCTLSTNSYKIFVLQRLRQLTEQT